MKPEERINCPDCGRPCLYVDDGMGFLVLEAHLRIYDGAVNWCAGHQAVAK